MRLLLATLALVAVAAAPAGAATTLRLDGIGPLKLGMSRLAAVKTGWLSHRAPGCELASPRPITYRLDGPRAPRALRGSAIFTGGRLRGLTVSAGATTAAGVTPGRTTVAEMVRRYREAGLRASSRFDSTFQATFVTIRRGNRQVLSGFAEKKVVDLVSLPFTPVCE